MDEKTPLQRFKPIVHKVENARLKEFRTPLCKVENILKGSLDTIPSPSSLVKIQIIGRKFFAGRCQQTFKNKKFVDK